MRGVVLFITVVATVAMLNQVGAQPATPLAEEVSGAFDINGRQLYIQCVGSGAPTVIFEAGQGNPGAQMASLQRELANDVMACTYDRDSQNGASTASPPSAADVVADLKALLYEAGVPSPYVLVGQSVGGLFVQLFARTYPEDVVGIVAMNPVPPAHPWLDQALPLMTEDEQAEEEAYYRGDGNGEVFDSYASSEQLEAAPAPPDIPFEMLISTIAQCDSPDDICGRTYEVYEAVMREVAAEWPQGHFSQVEAGHQTWEQAFDETLAVIRGVLERAARLGTPAATPTS